MISYNADPKIATVKEFVEWYRRRFSVITTPGRKAELSCEMHGEFYNLLFRQLMTTPYGESAWLELFSSSGSINQPILEGLLREIERFLSSQTVETKDSFAAWLAYRGDSSIH